MNRNHPFETFTVVQPSQFPPLTRIELQYRASLFWTYSIKLAKSCLSSYDAEAELYRDLP
jgi:hypothetical protein